MYGLGYDIEVISGLRLAEAKFTASQNIHGETGNFPCLAGGWAGTRASCTAALGWQRWRAPGAPGRASTCSIIYYLQYYLLSTIILSQ